MIENILNEVKDHIESNVPVAKKYTVSKGQQNGFEELINDVLTDMEKGVLSSPGNFKYKLHYGNHFPDLDIQIGQDIYGIEIKSRQVVNWTTNGNSVMESISQENYKEIYVLYGAYDKNKSKYFVKYKPYWEVTEDIKVTHSPRFYINMHTSNSVFKSKNEYDHLRSSNENTKIAFLQKYLKQKSKGSKWYIPPQSDEVLPIKFSTLDKDLKDRIICEIYILFPSDIIRFGPSGIPRSNYNNAMEYLISTYFCYTPSLRDSFSGSGKVLIGEKKYPRVIGNLKNNKDQIQHIISNSNNEFKSLAINTWKENNFDVDETLTFRDLYCSILDQIDLSRTEFNNLSLSQLLK